MRAIKSKTRLITSAVATTVLLFAAGMASAQTVVNLTAGSSSTTLPDGQVVPMWGYSCQGVTAGTGTCAALNPLANTTTANTTNAAVWSPVVITVPYTADSTTLASTTSLSINLTNNLSFTPATAGAAANNIPTSLVIVGQLGGGLGTGFTTTKSPTHAPQGVTWFAAGPPDTSGQPGGDPTTAGNATFTPPAQPDRVQSFATEVTAVSSTTVATCTVASGATPVPGCATLTWNNLRPGTYLIESGTHPSIQGPMGLYGILVVTTAPVSGASAGCAYPGATAGACALSYDADVPLLLSEIDAVQNTAVNTAVNTAGFSETRVWSGQPGQCGDVPPSTSAVAGVANTCYPPAVNYDPRYFLVNGSSFDRTKVANSTIAALAAAPTSNQTGNVVLRFVNAGSRMHVPSIVNAAMTIYAEDGNLLPGVPRKQNEVFLAAGKTQDVALQLASATTAYAAAAYPIYDRSLSLSTNSTHDGGMQAYLSVLGQAAPITSLTAPGAVAKTFYCSSGQTLVVADATKGLIGGVAGANGVTFGAATLPAGYSLVINPDGTFTYSPPATGVCGGTFTYNVNGAAVGSATITECDSAVHGTGCTLGTVTANADSYASPVGATTGHPAVLHIAPPGVLANDTDSKGYALSVDLTTAPTCSGSGTCSVSVQKDGSFTITMGATGSYTFNYTAKNSQGVTSAAAAAATVTVPAASGIQVTLIDNITNAPITSQDYRWTIEEDRTFYVDPACQVNSVDPKVRPASCPPLPVQSLGYNFHTATMPVVATGCTGPVSCEAGQTLLNTTPVACDQGNGSCRTVASGTGKVQLDPSQVPLDPTKHYFLTVAPADGINPTINGAGAPVQDNLACDPTKTTCPVHTFRTSGGAGNLGDCTGFAAAIAPTDNCGHSLGGVQINGATVAANVASNVANQFNIVLTRTPLPTAQITAFVYEDDYPVNGEQDASGVAVSGPAPFESGLGDFNIVLFDQAGGLGDATGQPTYDMFNQPLTNALSGWIDPLTGYNACPLTKNADGLIGMIPVCPQYEDGNDANGNPVPSPLVGQADINNLYPGLYEIQAFPGASRIARGEEWLQTNTLDGAKPHEAFVKPAEPQWFQEFGPGGFHVSIGFANPQIINDRRTAAGGPCATAGACTRSLYGQVTGMHMARTPDQRTYSSGDGTMYAFTQCYIAISAPDSYDFAFAKCNPDGSFEFSAANGNGPLPDGDYKLTVFDQWNDIMLDGLVNPVCVGNHSYTANNLAGGNPVPCPGGLGATAANPIVFPVTQWRTNLYTRTFIDVNGDGVSNVDANGNPTEPGLALVNTNIRYRDGSFGFFNNTDLNGFAGWNEIFPFMNWLVAETSSTRFKQTGTHIVYDAGGAVDGTPGGGTSTIADHLANTIERTSLPTQLRVPGAVYCTDADCSATSIQAGPYGAGTAGAPGNSSGPTTGLSSGAIIPPQSFGPSMAFQSMLGQSVFMEFGMRPMQAGENGGIQGHVIYASTRPFDDPQLLLQLSWEPGVANVQVNLYKEGTDANGQPTLTLVDTTKTTSWDDFAQGFRRDANGALIDNTYTYTDATGTSRTVSGKVTNMNCPGQDPTSPFFQTLRGSNEYLDQSQTVAADSLFKCYDGWSDLNQVQPAPYDGKYTFPSIVNIDSTTGRPAGAGSLNGTAGGVAGTNCTICTANPVDGWPMLPAGKYVVEVIVPKGYELVKEEDKNILMGDIYVAPVTVQFPGVGGNVFIMPDQAAVGASYNKNNALNMTQDLGSKTFPRHEGDTGSIETYWPCVGAQRTVPDYNSLFPGVGQNAPFAGATRNLCDRKEVTLTDQSTALAKFYIFTPAHISGHFTGTITNDFASEFDPFSPQFGEKFGPPNLPVGLRDYTGHEMARVYSDQWGIYNGLYYSSWEVNPPNPTGYAPQMSIACMNDAGPIPLRNAKGQYLDGTGAVVATPTVMITDPSYNPAYSNFCYEQPFMPGFTTYMDTPVIPTQAFADGYNLPDAEYPDGTPAVDSVTGDVAGPWVSTAGHNIVIKCLNFANGCNKSVQNPDFSGPGATDAPWNQKWITRNYGFGSTPGTVTIGGVTATGCSWGPTQITCPVPAIPNTYNVTTGVGSTCYNGSSSTPSAGQSPKPRNVTGASLTNYRCGELVITKSDGKRSIDAVTVTIAGTRTATPVVVSPSTTISGTFGAVLPNPIQTAIDAAQPGDLIIVAPGTYRERVIMWQPVRLQGAGPGSVIIDADAHPADALKSWRAQLNCVFGLSVNGVPVSADTHETSFDPNGTRTCPASMFLTGDRQPFEPIVNYDSAGNANLSEVLIEPTLMGAYEGAGITVVGRGVNIGASNDYWGIQASLAAGTAGAYPDGSRYLTNSNADCATSGAADNAKNYGRSNYKCNPSRIDGFSVTNSSQGGGGIFIHSWGHYLDVGNNRVYGNHGTLSGGVSIGNGETPGAYANDGTICGNFVAPPRPLCPPIPPGTVTNELIPLGLDIFVHLHNNAVYNNASLGDALFSATPSGAGGVTISAGSDNYRADHNWIAGNLSSGDGGGIAHSGQSFDGLIDHNFILYNQSTNPTLPTSGGGLDVIGSNNPRLLNGNECGNTNDLDCPPGLGDGTGKRLVIDSNLILGNSAESGTGGGVRLQQLNGTELTALPFRPDRWYDVTMTNNIIVNNLAGWDGAGVSLEDALKATIVNNTIASNDTTASAGVLFKTLGAANASSTPPGCTPTTDPTAPQNPNCLNPNAAHNAQPAGLVTQINSVNMRDALAALPAVLGQRYLCPTGYGYSGGTLGTLYGASCGAISIPVLTNDLFWQNRAFHVEIYAPGTATGPSPTSQQNLVAMAPVLNQAATGDCQTQGVALGTIAAQPVMYWDVGVRDDTSQNSGNGLSYNGTPVRLSLNNSILTPVTGVTYGGSNNRTPATSPVLRQFCNGSRVAPENGGKGYLSPPGRSETTGLTQLFQFNGIQPAATVDEGNNWINVTYGPLTLSSPKNAAFNQAGTAMLAASPTGATTGAYSITASSAAVNGGTNAQTPSGVNIPAVDFFGNTRTAAADIGAVEFPAPSTALGVINPASLSFAGTIVGTTSGTQTLTLSNVGGAALTGITFTVATTSAAGTGTFARAGGTCNAAAFTLAAGGSCTVLVTYTAPATAGVAATGTVTVNVGAGQAAVVNSPVTLTGGSVARTYTAAIGPSPINFGNWATGTVSSIQQVNVLNTGNSNLTNFTYTFASPRFARAGGTCPTGAGVLAAGASCTINVTYAPTATGALSSTLTVAANGGSAATTATFTPANVSLTGTGVAARAGVSVAPSPLTITLATGTLTNTGTVTLTNTAGTGGSNVAVTGVAVANGTGGGLFTWFFSIATGQDACTGATLPPGGSCTVGVRFTNVLSPRNVNRPGTITFTDTGTASPQVGNLIGHANP